LNPPQSVNEFLSEPEVRAQPPEQKNQQQGYQGDDYQVFQIAFSAIRTYSRRLSPGRQLPLHRCRVS